MVTVAMWKTPRMVVRTLTAAKTRVATVVEPTRAAVTIPEAATTPEVTTTEAALVAEAKRTSKRSDK